MNGNIGVGTCVCVCVCVRERERQRDRERQIQRKGERESHVGLLQLDHIPHLELWVQLVEAHLKIQGNQRKVRRSAEA